MQENTGFLIKKISDRLLSELDYNLKKYDITARQLEILDFLNTLDYENSKNSDVLLTDELDTVNAFFNDSNKINNFLTNYKNTSINNYDSYMYLAALNTIVNGKNLEWPVLSEEQQKILIKKLNSDSRAA